MMRHHCRDIVLANVQNGSTNSTRSHSAKLCIAYSESASFASSANSAMFKIVWVVLLCGAHCAECNAPVIVKDRAVDGHLAYQMLMDRVDMFYSKTEVMLDTLNKLEHDILLSERGRDKGVFIQISRNVNALASEVSQCVGGLVHNAEPDFSRDYMKRLNCGTLFAESADEKRRMEFKLDLVDQELQYLLHVMKNGDAMSVEKLFELAGAEPDFDDIEGATPDHALNTGEDVQEL
jgi:hypothetical protein